MNRFVTLIFGGFGGPRDVRPSLLGPNFFIFMQFLGTICQTHVMHWCPPLFGLRPPGLGILDSLMLIYHNCSFHLQISNFPFLSNVSLKYYSLLPWPLTVFVTTYQLVIFSTFSSMKYYIQKPLWVTLVCWFNEKYWMRPEFCISIEDLQWVCFGHYIFQWIETRFLQNLSMLKYLRD